MDREAVIRMAREAGFTEGDISLFPDLIAHFAALVAAAERERICKAIKEEDDYCVTEGDYMLDSNDCIAVAKSEWVRPDYSEAKLREKNT